MLTTARVFVVAAGAALLLGLLGVRAPQGADAQKNARRGKSPPRAGRPTATPDVRGESRFEFEKRRGAVEEALAVTLGRGLPATEDPAAAGEAMGRVARARATLRANPGAAAAAVIADLERLRPDDVEGHAALFTLLDVVADEDAAIRYWSAKLTSGTPRSPRPAPKTEKSKQPDRVKPQRTEVRDPERLIRYLAIAHLYRAALRGNVRAQGAILEAARSPHRDVKIGAVQYTYALNRNRWKARNELKSRLAPADQHLLYRY